MESVALAVELKSVTKTFGPVRAVVAVSVRFEAGEIAVIEGHNGSGKSTLLSLIGGLAKPTTGTVDYGELGKNRDAVRSSLGWVAHEALVYPDLTGRENVELAARLHGLDPAAAFAAAAARFGLGDFAHRPFRTYSRGQRQRVALARALGHAPKLVLLDEPTTGLDAAGMARVAEVIGEEAARGAIVIAVTHDPRLAEQGKRRYVMETGRLKLVQ
ncbi:MAG: heme ABC exporter ATP-binding protein CcmA [Polyangiaceae bacterium]